MNNNGAIGTIMGNTGLSNILETICNDNSVVHILGGKAVSRALRAHFIVDQCLSILIAEKTKCFKDDQSFSLLHEMYYDLKKGKVNIENNAKNEDLLNLKSHFVTVREELSSNSRTAALWILYQDLINLVRDFIDDWLLHIDSVSNSLPIFAAAGHHNYTKSTYLYLQSMLALKENNPEVYKNFSEGYFVVRRSDRTWAGLSPDLVIEQVLMRALKSTGGLTRRTGFNETQ